LAFHPAVCASTEEKDWKSLSNDWLGGGAAGKLLRLIEGLP
jgi:hypothetical protein